MAHDFGGFSQWLLGSVVLGTVEAAYQGRKCTLDQTAPIMVDAKQKRDREELLIPIKSTPTVTCLSTRPLLRKVPQNCRKEIKPLVHGSLWDILGLILLKGEFESFHFPLLPNKRPKRVSLE